MIDTPEHVKKLTLPQLQELAEEIRVELIDGLAKGGGHLRRTLLGRIAFSCVCRPAVGGKDHFPR